MKFYRYKQIQRLTFFGYDDLLRADVSSFSRTSAQSTNADTQQDTKILRFDVNRISNIQLSQYAKIVIEAVCLPITSLDPALQTRNAPSTLRMNNLNTNSFDSRNKGFNTTLIYTNDTNGEDFHNPNPKILYNFSIDQNFLKNGFIEFQITYPNVQFAIGSFDRFYASFVIYDMDEEKLLLKDTPEVNFDDYRAHYNLNNGRIPK